MSKLFQDIGFDPAKLSEEVEELEALLTKDWLSERHEILPFFRKRPTLSSRIAGDLQDMFLPNRIAYEYDIFGDFVADIAIGNTHGDTYCFVELEDAQENSIFDRRGPKYEPPFGGRLEHGHSQVIDWFCKLESLRGTQEIKNRFGVAEIDYHGILIVGRSMALERDRHPNALKYRLDWRSKNIRVLHKQVSIWTYDELLAKLKNQLRIIQAVRQ